MKKDKITAKEILEKGYSEYQKLSDKQKKEAGVIWQKTKLTPTPGKRIVRYVVEFIEKGE